MEEKIENFSEDEFKDEDILDDDNLGTDNFGNDSFYDDFGGGDQSTGEKYSDLLKELTNFDKIIQARIRNWLGLEWDDKLKDYTPKKAAIINEKGARWAIGCLQVYQAKPNIITNLAREEYINIKLEIVDLCWLVFPTLFDEFDIKDSADQWRLSNELQHAAFLVLAGTGDGKYSKFIGETHSIHENISIQPNNQQKQNNSNDNFFADMKNKLLGRK